MSGKHWEVCLLSCICKDKLFDQDTFYCNSIKLYSVAIENLLNENVPLKEAIKEGQKKPIFTPNRFSTRRACLLEKYDSKTMQTLWLQFHNHSMMALSF